MPLPEAPQISAFHAQFGHTLTVGIIGAYLLHIVLAASFSLTVLKPSDRMRFFIGIFAAFVSFAIGAVASYAWILPWLTSLYFEKIRYTALLIISGKTYSSEAAYMCFGLGLLCEMPVLAFVLCRFGFTMLRNRSLGYVIILTLAAVTAPTIDPVTFLAFSIPFIALYEVSLGTLRFKRFRGEPDRERYSY